MATIWVLGDQLNRDIGALAGSNPATDMILMIESEAAVTGRPFHRQRIHSVLASMRKFAEAQRSAGLDVACPVSTAPSTVSPT